MPPGACTSATSPSSLPIRARAIGLDTLIRPCLRSASSSPTIWYFTASPVASSSSSTLDPAFNEALTVFGGFVLGVFAQVTLGARLGNGVDDPGAVDSLEAVQLFLELFSATLGDGDGSHRVTPSFFLRSLPH